MARGGLALERTARAHFRVVRINRWSLALILLVALALILFPGRKLLPVFGTDDRRVQPGVTIGDRDFSGMTEGQAKAALTQMAPVYQARPVAARETYNPSYGVNEVIPELNGYELDVESTWIRLAASPPNTRLVPATRVHTPTSRLSDFPQAVIRQGNPDKQAVGLLINVDWGTDELKQMLPILKKHGVQVTFFVSGRWAAANKALLKQMSDEGHEIASHGYDLTYGPKTLAKSGQLKADIAKSADVIQSVTGTPVQFWAPHMSEISPEILQAASDLKMRTVLYSLDTVDWMESTTTAKIMDTVNKAMAGDLILMHPKPTTAKVLDQALQNLQSRGLKVLALSDLLSPAPDPSSSAWVHTHP
jgi:peptidoglycan/xylan/chitin deacetylase (PgdA/CDA1 family)